MSDSKTRFSDRVENYVKYRPDYPRQILAMLRDQIGFTASWKVADIGSGTGISARMFLDNGNPVIAIEPNAEMRAAGEESLRGRPGFQSIDASAEQTTVKDSSVDLIVCAQAFHWFDLEKCRIEFHRILKPQGWCVLIWNERQVRVTPLLEAYEDLLKRYGADYMAVRHERISVELLKHFYSGEFGKKVFSNQQIFDLDGLIGRCLSSSYAPAPGQPNHDTMVRELREIFARYQTNGRVAFEYETQVYFGRVG